MAYDKSDKRGVEAPDRNPDAITGAPGSHPLGTGIGTASGALTGAALGALGGPIGLVIGAIAGGITGGGIGHGIGEAVDPTTDEEYWRDNYKSRDYYRNDLDYDRDVSPAYRYGSAVGSSVWGYDSSIESGVSNTDVDRGDRKSASTQAGSVGNGVDDGMPGTAFSRAIGVDKPARTDQENEYEYTRHEDDVRSGWEHVRGQSNLTYDEARNAIKDAYERSIVNRRQKGQSSGTNPPSTSVDRD